jgi:hypothetical protein
VCDSSCWGVTLRERAEEGGHRVLQGGWCVVVTCRSWWHTDTCASTVGVHCSTPTSVKHSNQYTYTSLYTYFGHLGV